jgi:hypothetical protein
MAFPKPPVGVRQGVVIEPGILAGWSAHCQMPTPLRTSQTRLRMFFSSRDAANRSHVLWADLEAEPPWRVLEVCERPALGLGGLGTFDAQGVMPTAVVDRGDEVWMYYVGWTVRADVPYHNAIGLARSRDGGRTFERFIPGPVIGTGPFEPYFCGTGDLARIGERWVMWYMSATGWRIVDGKPEPRYHLKQAFSTDGVRWEYGGNIAVDYLSDAEGGIARATVLPVEDGYWMWFCHRGIENYRACGENAYRLGLAWSPDGASWTRLANQVVFSTEPAPAAFDRGMECYPAIYRGATGIYLFYNGSGFGQTGIGYARLHDAVSRDEAD